MRCDCRRDGGNFRRLCDIEFSEKDNRLWRLYNKDFKEAPYMVRFGYKWGRAFSVYRQHVPVLARDVFDAVLRRVPVNMCEEHFVLQLKQISQAILRRIMSTGISEAKYLLDLHVLGGYDTEMNRKDPMLTLFEEFGVEKKAVNTARMEKYVREVVGHIVFQKPKYSFEQFVSFRDKWANSGASSFGATVKLRVHGGRKQKTISMRNKWFKALAYTDKEIVEQCMLRQATNVKPFRKQDEPAAARTVQCFDTLSLIRCSYIEQMMVNLNGRKTWTTIGMSARQRYETRRRLLRMDGMTRICSDQSKFDVNQSKHMVMFALREIFKKVKRYCGYGDLCDCELANMEAAMIDDGRGGFHWKKGILSGMKFTALLDSILNYAASYAVCEDLGIPVEYALFQGDDAVMLTTVNVSSEALSDAYAQYGLSVNKDKTWIARNRCEFLHEIYSDGKVFGFPSRVMKSILWKKPVTGPTSGGVADIEEEFETFRKGVRRGLVGLERLAKKLMQRVFKDVDWVKFWEAWRTPQVLGGLGFGTEGRMVMRMTSESKVKPRVEVEGKMRYRGGDSVLNNAILFRVEGLVALPGYEKKVYFERLPKVKELPPYKQFDYSTLPYARIEWTLEDFSYVEKPYERKLILESKLRSNDLITEDDVPTKLFWNCDLDKAVRIYNRLRRWSANLTSAMDHAEVFEGIARRINKMWAGYCLLAAIGKEKMRKMTSLQRALAWTAWRETKRLDPEVSILV